ncbi:MAG: apolipoprotein N-acyltransferase [Bacteroidetes bacterium]|nr:apolipoprotein N-acyltransferase [Bacteroidota bacterium]MCL5268574.1 apolipoprotein N-acyltransferase [Bacteroidota bacterium]
MKKTGKFLTSKLALGVVSGLLLGFSFPPFHFEWLAFVGLVPFLIAIDDAPNYKEVFKLTYFSFLVFNVITIYWVGGWSTGADPFLLIGGAALVIGHPLFFAVPMLVYHFVQKRLGKTTALFLFPFLYLSFEHLHSITQVAFPWLTLGYSQSYNLADIQFASYAGLFGVSLQILIVNVLFAYALMLWLKDPRQNMKRAGIAFAIGLLFVIIPEIYGSVVLRDARNVKYRRTLRVAVVQPNINPYAKWVAAPDEILHTYKNETKAALSHNPELVVWPETAIPFYILLPPFSYDRESLQSFIDTTGISLLSGVPLAHYFADSTQAGPTSHYDEFMNEYYDAYNGAALFLPHSDEYQTYRKIVLVPFGERIPYAEAVPFLIKPLKWGVGISNWSRGKDTTVFRLEDGLRFSTVICYESVFPGFVREFVKKGADFLVIITNDGWYGKSSGPYQHAAYAIFRAIENRRTVVRSANTGISEFISPYGQYIGKLTKLDERATLFANIPIDNQMTFYSEHGNWIAHLAELIASASVILGLFLKFRHKE